MKITQKYLDELTYEIIGSAIAVHKEIGPGLIESVYQRCFNRELQIRGIHYETQQQVPVFYKGTYLDADLRYDTLIEGQIITELKSIDALHPIHDAVLLTYMKLLQKPKGILINFNCTNIFKEGQKTLVNEYYAALPKI